MTVGRDRRRVMRGGVWAVLAAAVAPAGWASAQEVTAGAPGVEGEGPVIVGQRPTYERVYFDRPVIGLGLVGVYRDESVKAGETRNKAKEYFFSETFDLTTRGYVLHPNFLDIELAGAAGANESFFDVNGDSGTTFSWLYTWDAKATLFRAQNPVTLSSVREQAWQFPQFGPALQTTTTSTGVSWDIRNTSVPTHLSVNHVESTQDGLQRGEDFSYTRDTFNWFSTWRPAPDQLLRWSYNLASTEQQGATSQSYDEQDAELSHEWLLGRRRQHTLRSSLDYSLREGDQTDYQSIRWAENLTLKHTDTFSTRYLTNVDRYDVVGSARERERAEAGFQHRLYQSLITTGRVGAQRTGADGGGDTTGTFADLSLDYDKRVPYGALAANLGYTWDHQDADGGTEPLPILDQAATFTDPTPIVLTGTNIDPRSIVITDPSGLVLYQPGVDYTVTSFPDRVEINRVVGGRIGPDQTVLLDYNLLPLPGSSTTTNVLAAGLRYDIDQGFLRGLGVYTRYTTTDQSIESATPEAFVPNSFTDTLYGADYRFWDFFVGAEHQTHSAEINPFDADRLFAKYTKRIDVDTVLQIATAYSQINYTEPENTVDLWTVSAVLKKDFSRRLTGTATVLYRMETDELRGDTTGWEEQLEMTWRHRQTQVYMMVRNAQLDTIQQEENFLFVQVGIRREF